MSILKRFGYYSIGLGIGIVFVAFFFKKKDTEPFCYFPNCRVLKDIRSKIIEVDIQTSLTKDDFIELFTHGDVLFSKSDTKATPCKIYVIEGVIAEKEIEVTLENCSDKVVIKKINDK
ncbi:DUF4258 domain-containing protein [Capnocytophaga canis]|uniref:hypothetical protein n=1 Tax=Capnocytophaga TaxID=1016 RepID=UPI000BB19A04|nr:hypothetical protein [Capnocytophaga sp. H2931]ATA75900.1 hypothetical protein CGC52_11035 [Capnocytophaga sp. H2931]